MKKLKFMVEVDTLFLTDYAKSYEIADEIKKAISEAAGKLPFVRETIVTPWDEVQP
jgi:hypothetical protein